jgi:hypothetical protein
MIGAEGQRVPGEVVMIGIRPPGLECTVLELKWQVLLKFFNFQSLQNEREAASGWMVGV